MKNLSPSEVTELCDAAQAAWNKLRPRQKKAEFSWRGERYVATHTTFRLLVNTLSGEPVAERFD